MSIIQWSLERLSGGDSSWSSFCAIEYQFEIALSFDCSRVSRSAALARMIGSDRSRFIGTAYETYLRRAGADVRRIATAISNRKLAWPVARACAPNAASIRVASEGSIPWNGSSSTRSFATSARMRNLARCSRCHSPSDRPELHRAPRRFEAERGWVDFERGVTNFRHLTLMNNMHKCAWLRSYHCARQARPSLPSASFKNMSSARTNRFSRPTSDACDSCTWKWAAATR